MSFSVENGVATEKLDDDGRSKRTGTMWTASAHIITAVIGSGVLSLAWAIAQLGWIAGPAALIIFSFITWFASALLADCYRDPVTGNRNYTYMDAVKTNLGGFKFKLCGLAQYSNLVGVTIGYTLTTAISMAAMKKSNCFHYHGHNANCHPSNNPFMIIYGVIQLVLSQIPNFHKLSILSTIAAVMSFAYSSIGIGLAIAQVAGNGVAKTSVTGRPLGEDYTGTTKVWNTFQALGNIAFAYAFSTILIEIQDTIRSEPPENEVMKRASFVGISITTLFYMSCGIIGYAAFGHTAPGNFLTGFGFYEPFWLVDIANLCIVIHLIGAYQVFCQPVFGFFEGWCQKQWPNSGFIAKEYYVPMPFGVTFRFNLFRLVWRTLYVIFTTVIAMLLPFFNDFVGLLGAASFWPLTVYFPVEMYIARRKIRIFSATWIWLQLLSMACLVVSLLAAAGSVEGLALSLKSFKVFQSRS